MPVKEASSLSVPGVYFTCPLTGTTLTKNERETHINEAILTSLVDGWQPFELVAPGGHRLKEEEEVALNECGLVPSALLSLCWDAAVQAAEASAGGPSAPLLRAELLENIQTIS